MKDIERMKEVHEQIKNHIWRRTGHSFESYSGLVRILIDLFYDALKEDYAKTNTRVPFDFFHDTCECIYKIKFMPENLSPEIKIDCLSAIDSAIGTIHHYIETGEFVSFMTFWSGSNFHKKKGRWTQWSFHEKLNRFDWHPKYKEIVIEDYETNIRNCKDPNDLKSYQKELEYWKTL